MPEPISVDTGFAPINGTQLYYESAGAGHPLVLIHGGLVDNRLWDDQFAVFAHHYRVIRYDLRGFGSSTTLPGPYAHHEDLRGLLRYLSIDSAYVLGLSMGGGVAIDFTLAYPNMVAALIPVASALNGYPDSEYAKGRWAEISAVYERGDQAHAVELSIQMWTDGSPRSSEQVAADVRERVRAMTAAKWALPDTQAVEQPLEPAANERLAEIRAPTLVIVGDQDVDYIMAIADLLAASIPGAHKAVIPDTAHHLNMEQPQVFNRIVLDFLASVGSRQ